MFRNRFFGFCMAPDTGGAAGGSGEGTQTQQTTQQQAFQFDYDKLAGIIQLGESLFSLCLNMTD